MPSAGVDVTKLDKINTGDRVEGLMIRYDLGVIVNKLFCFIIVPGRW